MPTSASRLPPTSRSTSVIRAVPGSAAQMRTPTACCVSTSEGNRLLAHLSELSERDCSAAQSTSAKDLGLPNASRWLGHSVMAAYEPDIAIDPKPTVGGP